MKKVLLLLVCLFTLQTVVWADDDKPIQVNQLPQTAQTISVMVLTNSSKS